MSSCIDNCIHKIDGQHSEECFRCSRCYSDLYEEKKEYRIEKRYYGEVIAAKTVYSLEEAKNTYKAFDATVRDCSTECSCVVLLFIDNEYMKIPEAEKLVYTVKEIQKHLILNFGGVAI